ncbi:MAG: hypothetical protein Q8K59_13245 [Nitrosomonas sp.]|nr:hypothetical protein [Nitrosomonas sp.]MDP1952022.1 hypothetical protein [Nitrosomonas sp.]
MASKKDQQSHIEAWWASGISQAAYCRKHGLNTRTIGKRKERIAVVIAAEPARRSLGSRHRRNRGANRATARTGE